MKTDNPAGRLLNLLEKGRTIERNVKNRDAWGMLLEVEDSNSPLLMYRLGKVMELPKQVIEQIKLNFPNQQNTHSHWSTRVNQAFGMQNLNGKWHDFNQHIDQHTLDYLSMSVDMIDSKGYTQVISSEKLTEIHEKISNLRQDAIDSDELDESFKKIISVYLQKILSAIDEYKISGAVPIMENIEQTLGRTFFDEAYRATIQRTQFGEKLLTTLTFVADITTISLGLPQISDGLQALLAISDAVDV